MNGTKLRVQTLNESNQNTTDYAGNFVYQDEELSYILTPEGGGSGGAGAEPFDWAGAWNTYQLIYGDNGGYSGSGTRGTNMSGGGGGTFAGHGAGISGFGYTKLRNSGGSAFMVRPPGFDDPPGGVWIYLDGSGYNIGLGANSGGFFQEGTAVDAFGYTYFQIMGFQLTDGSDGNFVIGFDIDGFEVGGGYYWKGNSFDDFVRDVNFYTLSGLPVDISFDPSGGYVAGTVSAGWGYGLSQVKTTKVKSLSISYSDYNKVKDSGIYSSAGSFQVRNINDDQTVGDLYYHTYLFPNVDLKTKVYSDDGKRWKSQNYINSQNRIGIGAQQSINYAKYNRLYFRPPYR